MNTKAVLDVLTDLKQQEEKADALVLSANIHEIGLEAWKKALYHSYHCSRLKNEIFEFYKDELANISFPKS